MRQGTTPTIPLYVDADITEHTVEVSFKSGNRTLTVGNDRLEMSYEDGVTTILVTLTQEETLAMRKYVKINVRAIKDGIAVATNTGKELVEDILRRGVIVE